MDVKFLVLGISVDLSLFIEQYGSHTYSENSVFKIKLSNSSHNQPLIFSHL